MLYMKAGVGYYRDREGPNLSKSSARVNLIWASSYVQDPIMNTVRFIPQHKVTMHKASGVIECHCI